MVISDDDMPLYGIGVVAELIGVHPETLRIWERNGLIKPARQNRQRLYSNNDLRKLTYVHHLIEKKGLNIAGVKQVVDLYPCWWLKNCPGGRAQKTTEFANLAKPCWKHEGTYCFTVNDKADYCQGCTLCQRE